MTLSRHEREREKRHKAFIQALKDRPCSDCGIKYIPPVMEFDHLRDKSFQLSRPGRRSKETILKEIQKCDLVCSNCHRIRTHNRQMNLKKADHAPAEKLLFELQF